MISVIVPVFQRESFINKTIDAILQQSYEKVELILIDDGSTDDSGQLCDKYAEKDSRVCVIHQENMGTNKAREVGIKKSTGEFLCFIDSDDLVDNGYLERLINAAEQSQADIVISGIRLVYPDGKTEDMFSCGKEGSIKKDDAIKGMISRRYFGWELVGKLYKKDLFLGYSCDANIKYAEDLLTNWELFNRADSFYYTSYIGYSYLRHGDNMTLNSGVRRIDTAIAYDEILNNCLYSGEATGSILKRIERDVSDIMVSWILSEDPVDDTFRKLQVVLSKTLSEEKKIGIVPDREYLELRCDHHNLRGLYKEVIICIIEKIRAFCGSYNKVFIFGCGKWALRVAKLLEDNSIHFDGFVVSEMQNVKNSQKLITSDVKELKEIGREAGIILCVSDSIREEVLTAFSNHNISDYVDITGEGHYIRYYFESPLAIKNNPKIQAELRNYHFKSAHEEKTIIFEARNGFGLGGIEMWTKEVCKGLVTKGYDRIRVLARINEEHGEWSELVDVAEETNDTTEYCLRLLKYYLDKLPCVLISSQPTEELMVATIIKEYFPEAIMIISVIHGGLSSIYDNYLKYLPNTQRIIAVSKMIKGDLVARGIPENKILVKAALFTYKNYERRIYSIDGEPIRIGYAGRIEYSQKRVDLLIKMIAEMVNRNIDFIFELAGEGEAYNDLVTYTRTNGLEDRIIMCGTIRNSEIPEFWMHQDIAVNLSDFEGHSISQMEAMAGGAVPVVTDTSGVRDDITDGENGFVVPVGDFMRAADAIEALYDDRSKIEEMGARAHNSIMEKSDYNKHIDFWEELLKGV